MIRIENIKKSFGDVEVLKGISHTFEAGKTNLIIGKSGAGKTVMAAEVAKRLFQEGMIDLVLCFSPSLSVAEGMKKTFSWKLECSFNGGLGSLGGSYTYQSIRFLDENFWNTVSKYRVLVVFDEIHHCSFDDEGRSRSRARFLL